MIRTEPVKSCVSVNSSPIIFEPEVNKMDELTVVVLSLVAFTVPNVTSCPSKAATTPAEPDNIPVPEVLNDSEMNPNAVI